MVALGILGCVLAGVGLLMGILIRGLVWLGAIGCILMMIAYFKIN